MPTLNRQITLAARPVGMPTESDFSLVESPIPHPARGEVLVQALYLSVDPYVRGRLTGVTTYARGLDLGEVIVGGVVGRVLDSSDPRYGPDDIVEGMLGWQEYAVAPAKSLRKIDSSNGPISSALYVLGMPGLTAAGRDGAGIGSRRRRGLPRGSDRQNQTLPGHRHCGH